MTIAGLALLIAFILYREWVNQQIIAKLMDRLMSKSLAEYMAISKAPATKAPVSMSDREEYEAEMKRLGEVAEKEEE